MRLRIALLAAMASTLVAVAVPSIAAAAPHHNRGLTIHAAPNPIMAGDGVLIYGQLNGNDVSSKRIVLYHHISGSHTGFTRISVTTTDSHGFYEFTRAEGIVQTNRSWFVTAPALPGVHSRTIHERVAALVGLTASSQTADTSTPIVFSGHVDPNHRFEQVLLQQQNGASGKWKTIKTAVLGRGSNYVVKHRFRVPGEHNVRVVFPGDHRNIQGVSAVVTVTIQQAEVPDFTIGTSDPVISYGQSATISGTLYMKGTKTPQPSTPVTLCSSTLPVVQFTCDTAGITGTDGGYSFTVAPVHNEVYQVMVTLSPDRKTARLFEGVRDLVTLSASPSTVAAGQPVTLTGTATPDKTGDTVYLQRFGADGNWHMVASRQILPGSTFKFVRVPGNPGTRTFRAQIPGDSGNAGGASPAVTVTVTPAPPSALPQS